MYLSFDDKTVHFNYVLFENFTLLNFFSRHQVFFAICYSLGGVSARRYSPQWIHYSCT